jgi:site-specific DNA-methyltransferase (adenine-specific)
VTAPYYEDGAVTLFLGDCLDVLRTLPDASVDAVVTDPPAGISFMGRAWDGDLGGRGRWIAWHAERLTEAARVLKPGGHALVWALPRTSHWTACAVEDAGLTIRDCLTHLFGSGFPKGGNALKPASEHWWLARRPLSGTVAQTVLEHGTGALNIAACRTAVSDRAAYEHNGNKSRFGDRRNEVYGVHQARADSANGLGRWPTNVVFSHPPLVVDGEVVGDACASGCVEGCPVAELDRQSGHLKSGLYEPHHARNVPRLGKGGVYGDDRGKQRETPTYGDEGGASRFFPTFRYEAKAPAHERPKLPDGTAWPTVKPLGLMRWLIRLVTPPGGLVLDPFAGSGATSEACVIEGFRCLLIDQDPIAAELIKTRLAKPISPVLDFGEEIA